jgi:hypothetical protein
MERSGPRWTAGGTYTGRGGASPTHDVQVLLLARAHRQWLRGTRAMRQCCGVTHERTSGGGVAAQ